MFVESGGIIGVKYKGKIMVGFSNAKPEKSEKSSEGSQNSMLFGCYVMFTFNSLNKNWLNNQNYREHLSFEMNQTPILK